MKELGFEKFFLVGHDRGGRVSHRLTKDHPDSVQKLVTLDIIPTRTMFQIVNKDFATNTYHWFFLIQPYDFPERVIGADPEFYAGRGFNRVKDAETVFTPEALADYLRCFNNPPSARTTVPGPPSTWSTMTPTSTRRSTVPCWPCGAPPATSGGPKTS